MRGYGKEAQCDLVMAGASDISTIESPAAEDQLQQVTSELRSRVVNVVDLMTLQPEPENPHGLSAHNFDELITTDKANPFIHHGYPWWMRRLTYLRSNPRNLHVRDYQEEGTMITQFGMVMSNKIDHFHHVMDAAERVSKPSARTTHLKQAIRAKHKPHSVDRGMDRSAFRRRKRPPSQSENT